MLAVELCERRIQLGIHAVKLGRHFGQVPLGLAGSFIERTQILRRDAGEIGVDRASDLLRDLGPVRLRYRLESLLLVPLEINLRQLEGWHGSSYDRYVSTIYRSAFGFNHETADGPRRRRL